jgi:hypothetical protein
MSLRDIAVDLISMCGYIVSLSGSEIKALRKALFGVGSFCGSLISDSSLTLQ